MHRTDIWRFELHEWAHIPLGTEPVLGPIYDEAHPHYKQQYAPQVFLFTSPPSRAEFMAVIDSLPYMGADKGLPALLNANPWPMMEPAHDGASVELYQNERLVGQLSVNKTTLWQNAGYSIPMLTMAIIHQVVRYVKGDKDAAFDIVEKNRHRILEEAAEKGSPGYVANDDTLKQLCRKVLKAKLKKAV